MSKKRLVTLILSIGIFLSLAATVFAAGQPRRYNENSTVKGTISQSFYQVNAKTDVAVKRITVTGTLYEKGTFGTWQKVSSCSNTPVHLLPAQQAVIIIQSPEDRIALNVQQHSLIQMGRAKLSHQLPAIK